MTTKRFDTYAIFLHVVLVAMALLIARLAFENHQLKQPPVIAQLEVGDTVAPVSVNTLDGEEQTLQWAGGAAKERLLLVFTTTCPACRDNQATWRSLHERLGESVDVVGISLDKPEATQVYRQDHALPFPVVIPKDLGSFSKSYEISAVPLTLHIGGDGQVKGTWLGSLSPEQVTDLETNLADRPSMG